MSDRGAQQLRALGFGAMGGGLKGVAISIGESVVLLTGPEQGPLQPVGQAQLDASSEGDWMLGSPSSELTVSPIGEASRPTTEDRPAGLDQLCTVRGRTTVEGSEMSVEAVGMITVRAELDPRALDSLRWVCVWFEDHEGLALVALRPRKSRGHDREVVTASLLEATGSRVVADPRLSTTYDAHGNPRRAGLELWIEGEDGHQFSRRAAGQALAAPTTVSEPPLEVLAEPLGWQSRGREGVGMYVLVRPG